MRSKRRGPQRRTKHAMPLPPRDGGPVDPADVTGAEMAFGPQAELCRRTMCCACWAAARIVFMSDTGRQWDPSVMRDVDWSELPELPSLRSNSVPHHEPPRGLKCNSGDRDTLPLCPWHHTEGWAVRRHGGGYTAKKFWDYFCIDWRAVLDEMRRRVSDG